MYILPERRGVLEPTEHDLISQERARYDVNSEKDMQREFYAKNTAFLGENNGP